MRGPAADLRFTFHLKLYNTGRSGGYLMSKWLEVLAAWPPLLCLPTTPKCQGQKTPERMEREPNLVVITKYYQQIHFMSNVSADIIT